MADAIDIRLSQRMQRIARRVHKVLEQEMPEAPLGFGLVVFPLAERGEPLRKVEYQYISNTKREHMHEAMRSMVAKWDAGHVDVPPHEKQ